MIYTRFDNPILCSYLYFIIISLLFSCRTDKLPSIDLMSDESISADVKKPVEVRYNDGHNELVMLGHVKARGGSSIKYEKRSFSLELDHKYPLGHIESDDDWILNANYIDKTFMRHKMSYDIFRQMNPQNISPLCAYIAISLNNQDQGLYVLMQEINAGLLKLNRKDKTAVIYKDPPVFIKERIQPQEEDNYYQQKYPPISKKNLSDDIEAFRRFLFDTDDKTFAQEIDKWIDLRNVMDWQLLLLLSNNSDGILKNFYLYKLNQSTPYKIAIWDYDHAYGRDGDGEYNMLERVLDCNRSVLFRRLNQMGDYSQALKKRYHQLRDNGVFSLENFDTHIRNNASLVSDYLEDNFRKWPVGGSWYYDDKTFDEEVEIMKKYFAMRLPQLDERFDYSL